MPQGGPAPPRGGTRARPHAREAGAIGTPPSVPPSFVTRLATLALLAALAACSAPKRRPPDAARPKVELAFEAAPPEARKHPAPERTPPPARPGVEVRDVLCLYDPTEDRSAQISETHLYAETALNFLGLVPVYRDVNEPLPGDAEMSRYRGVLTWFMDNRMKRGREYWRWLGRQPAAGRKVVILGNLGATYDVPPAVINEGLRPLGLTYLGKESENTGAIEILKKDSLVEFERTLDRELRWFIQVKADPSHQVFLRARRTDLKDSESDLVTVGPHGGFSWVAIHYDSEVDRDQWRLNPFTFLAKAFAVEDVPKPDITTAMGRRIFFASIDGDGMGNSVQPGPKTGRLCGELVREDFIRKYDLPVTASVIAADLDEYPELVKLAQSIFELPNVEVAAHGYYHPISWKRKTFPEGREGKPFSLEKEVIEAVKRVQSLTPKPLKAYLWTGDCAPPPEAVEMTYRLGIANMNGSDPGRYQNYESLANLRSPTLLNGSWIQFNARSMSENHFTDLWTRNFFAYRNALWTYQRTGSPRRITPIHVYFHYYVVEQPGGELALREIYSWVLKQEIYPMTVSEYVDWVRGFFSARLERRGPGEWRVRDYRACRTVRFDDCEAHVDLARSSNVLGYRHTGTTLYVHLRQADEARIVLTREAQRGVYLVEANGDWKGDKIVGRTAASATFMTPAGPLRLRSDRHEMEVDLR